MRKLTNTIHKLLNFTYIRYPNVMHPQFYPIRYRVERSAAVCHLSNTFLERVITAFHKSPTPSNGDIWSSLIPHSAPFTRALESKNLTQLREEINKLFNDRGTLTGMAHTARFMHKKGSFSGNHISIRTSDVLISLAEALAVIGVRSNIQTLLWRYIQEQRADLVELKKRVEKALGHALLVPQIGAPPLVIIGDEIFSPDGIRHAYIPFRIEQLEFKKNDNILEIGGGFGTMAAYAAIRGYRNYTIIDLPFANALQALFLASWLGEEKVTLYGETAYSPIRLVPSTDKNALDTNYSLVINVDSLPEIAEAADYIDLISKRSKYFLSVNQESENVAGEFKQWSVSQLCNQHGRFKRLSRHIYWMEQGYVEELYQQV